MINVSYGTPSSVRTAELPDGATVAQLIQQTGLEVPTGYELRVAGVVVPSDQWATKVLQNGQAVIAVQQVKGNVLRNG